MEFVAIDVETANQKASSICQIGVAVFREGRLQRTWGTLINPEEHFSPFNVRLHGIGPEKVADTPTWADVQPMLDDFLHKSLLASHTYFDRRAMQGANERYGLRTIPVSGWLDTCQIARRAWPHLANHKLTSLAENFGIVYGAHDAVEDARCAGEILLLAGLATGLAIKELHAPAEAKKSRIESTKRLRG